MVGLARIGRGRVGGVMNGGLTWNRMLALGEAETRAVLAALPADVRRRVADIPIVFERRAGRALERQGIAPDSMGAFLGPSALDDPGADPEPARIVLFLDSIRKEAEDEEDRFRGELRTTLLHEIGHVLGWGEAELEARGLE